MTLYVANGEKRELWNGIEYVVLDNGSAHEYTPYVFPAIKAKSAYDQAIKIREEANEVIYAVKFETREKVIEETIDEMQACETLLRYLEVSDEEFLEAQKAVYVKNLARGYYD